MKEGYLEKGEEPRWASGMNDFLSAAPCKSKAKTVRGSGTCRKELLERPTHNIPLSYLLVATLSARTLFAEVK